MSLLKAGAKAIFLELSPGKYRIADSDVVVEPCSLNPRHFVSRATGHPLVKNFQPNDFKCWYDPAVGYITPILENCFLAEDFEPILRSGNGGWETNWYPTLAAGQKNLVVE